MTNLPTHPDAEPTYVRELGDGLIARWSTAADAERIAQVAGIAFRSSENEVPSPRVMDQVRFFMSGKTPLMGPGDFALVEDTRRNGRPAVAATCLWREAWEYDGIPFAVGRPETVVTEPAYRNRGLIRVLFDMVHARCAAEQRSVQAITGIPYFYRQFGYEYALDLGGKRVTFLSLIPPEEPGQPEPYTLRQAEPADIPLIAEQYDRPRADSLVWRLPTEGYFEYVVEFWRGQEGAAPDPIQSGVNSRFMMLVDRAGRPWGYVNVAAKRWGRDLIVYDVQTAPGLDLRAAVPPLLRALAAYGAGVPAIKVTTEPFHEIAFMLGRSHPLYDVLGDALAPYHVPPYAWYMRVPDVLGFIRYIRSSLEQRLVDSPVAGYSGECEISFYRSGMRLAFEVGKLVDAQLWRIPSYGASPDAQYPPLVFLQALFGYRSLDELRTMFPDVLVAPESEVLIKTLFPKRQSFVQG